ncbi:MAG: class I tRNA ligase family protein, partial [Gemmatimonadales bacterium]
MFLGAFQEGGDFRDEGITGIRRFLEKVWALGHEVAPQIPGTPGSRPGSVASPLTPAVAQKLHQTIRKVTADTESLDYNTAISAMMEYVNLLRETGGGRREAVEPLVIMLAPYAPHLAEELWERLGHEASVFEARWPSYDERIATAEDVTLVVQVNGKVRSRLTVHRGLSEREVVELALRDEAARKFVDGKTVRKVVFVPDRLVNLVV